MRIILKKQVIWIAAFLLMNNSYFAFAITETAPQQSPTPSSVSSSDNKEGKDYCPEPHTLTKEGLLWQAKGGWVSYGESFDTRVVRFFKAEWIGINIGKIICLYKGDKPIGFPIALEQKYHKMVPVPFGANWSKDNNKGEKGYKECIAHHVKDCPFIFEKPAETGDIYQSLDFFKGKKGLGE